MFSEKVTSIFSTCFAISILTKQDKRARGDSNLMNLKQGKNFSAVRQRMSYRLR
jgi:hypothetical protein